MHPESHLRATKAAAAGDADVGFMAWRCDDRRLFSVSLQFLKFGNYCYDYCLFCGSSSPLYNLFAIVSPFTQLLGDKSGPTKPQKDIAWGYAKWRGKEKGRGTGTETLKNRKDR